jgi:hypothetical protein
VDFPCHPYEYYYWLRSVRKHYENDPAVRKINNTWCIFWSFLFSSMEGLFFFLNEFTVIFLGSSVSIIIVIEFRISNFAFHFRFSLFSFRLLLFVFDFRLLLFAFRIFACWFSLAFQFFCFRISIFVFRILNCLSYYPIIIS